MTLNEVIEANTDQIYFSSFVPKGEKRLCEQLYSIHVYSSGIQLTD